MRFHLVVLAAAAVTLSACAREDAPRLSSQYPQAARRILSGPGFSRSGGSFVRAEPTGTAPIADPVEAAEASLSRRAGLQLRLPAHGADAASFTLPGGAVVNVRERGLAGPARTEGAALAYPRTDGTSYWTATADGFEEWIEVADAGAGPVAGWDVSGGMLRQAGDAVEVSDAAGRLLARVTAPRAYEAGGAEKRAWLRADGARMALFTDARGPALVDPTWTAGSAMASVRTGHTATLLPSGKVLVAGGKPGATSSAVATTELYDPATGTWTAAASMAVPRDGHVAVLLGSGKVLVAAGENAGTGALQSAELYDPDTGLWTATGSLVGARIGATATLLTTGKVLVAGGTSAAGAGYLATSELYDPVAGSWGVTAGPLAAARTAHTTTLLQNGKALVAGGYNSGGRVGGSELFDPATGSWTGQGTLTARYAHTATLLISGLVLVAGGTAGATGSSELYNPATGLWSATTGAPLVQRVYQSAALLPSGKVLMAGGVGADYVTCLTSAEVYDPVAGTWSAAGTLSVARTQATSTVLPSGKILFAGGGTASNGAVATVDLYDPTTGTWSGSNPLAEARYGHSATLLLTGEVLVVGGSGTTATLATAQLYDPAAGSWITTGSMATPRLWHTATLLPTGQVLVAGGASTTAVVNSAELYDPNAGTWSSTGSMLQARNRFTATLLPTGKVLVAGGHDGTSGGFLAGAELYDPAAGTWAGTGALSAARYVHTATMLPSGKVLVAGGYDGTAYLGGCELFDPRAGTWTATGPLKYARFAHTANLLPTGKVLVAGGVATIAPQAFELYDPVAETWSDTPPLFSQPQDHTTTLMPSGRALFAGGSSAGFSTSAVGLYDPATATFTSTAALAAARARHTATLLPSGQVLVTGGAPSGGGKISSAEIFDDGRGALAAWIPTVTAVDPAPPAVALTGGSFSLTGTLFTGISEASSGGTGSSATNRPLVQLQHGDGGATFFADVTAFSATAATATVPATLHPGVYWVRVIVAGVVGGAQPIVVGYSPVSIGSTATSTPPRGSLAFSATGGSTRGWAWTLTASPSGGSINPATGAYTAGANGGVTDVVKVLDSMGNASTLSVSVGPGVGVNPASSKVATGTNQDFTAAGGSGTGWAWSISDNRSGGVITPAGRYQAGPITGVTDTVKAVDSLSNEGTAQVQVVTVEELVTQRSAYGCSSAGGGGGPWLLVGATALFLALRRRPGRALLALAVALPLAAHAAPAKEQKVRVAVMPVKAGLGVEPGLASLVTDALVADLADRGLTTITSKDVEAALGFEKQKQMLGCDDQSCLAEIAGSLGADRVISGDIAQVKDLTIVSLQLFNTRTGTVEQRFHERMSGGDAADLLDATERAGETLFPGTVRAGKASRRKSVMTSAARPLALVARGGYDVRDPGGFGVLMLEYRLSRSMRVGAGPLGTGASSYGAAVRAAWYPLVFERLSVYGAAEAHLLFPSELLVAASLALGAEWAFSERFAMSLEVPLTLLASAPAGYRTTYFMPGFSASWRF